MLNVEYRLKLGQDEFIIKGEYKNEKEFFNKMSFFSSLPKTAPGGATDLKLVVRETKKGKYYSLISEQEKLEFQLGQHKEGDTLYAKGWVPLYQGDAESYEENAGAAPIGAPKAAAVAPIAPIAPIAAPVQAPVQQAAPPVTQQFVAPAPVAPAPVAAPAPVQAAPAAPAPAANPQVTAVANNVLARFGINK